MRYLRYVLAGVLVVSSIAIIRASDGGGQYETGGSVMPGSLSGVNPVYHPDIFGDPRVAASYGFVHTSAGWTTMSYQAPAAKAAAGTASAASRAYAYAPLPKPRPVKVAVRHVVPRAPLDITEPTKSAAIDYRVVSN